jgi:hypothetical protein
MLGNGDHRARVRSLGGDQTMAMPEYFAFYSPTRVVYGPGIS